jgi:enamine deaminase RidA (YjgF/YER057c/UK114 family)
MKMQHVSSPHVKEAPLGPWSNCRVFGNQIFVAGMTANDGKGGMLVEVNAIGFLAAGAGA